MLSCCNIEKSESELKVFQWQTERDDCSIELYSAEDSLKLERARAKGLHALNMVIDGIGVVVDLKKMEERNKDTGDLSKVMRVKIKPQGIIATTSL